MERKGQARLFQQGLNENEINSLEKSLKDSGMQQPEIDKVVAPIRNTMQQQIQQQQPQSPSQSPNQPSQPGMVTPTKPM